MILMKLKRRLLASTVALALMLLSWGQTSAQTGDVQYFPETGHNVRDDFLKHYRSVADPTLVFGYPITEQIVSLDGRTVQYFQRARFELNAGLPEPLRIQLSPLGRSTYVPGRQLNIDHATACQLFPTGYRVCFTFLDFYRAHGGAEQFGNPISPFEFHDSLIVQYFEKARFEWRADRPEGQRVVITDLGRIYFDQLGEDKTRLRPLEPLNATINAILEVRVRAFVANTVARSSGEQTVHIMVQNQTLHAISGATGKVIVRWPDGRVEEFFFTTNNLGLGSVSFDFRDQQPGELVPIEVIVTYGGLAGSTRASFRIWY